MIGPDLSLSGPKNVVQDDTSGNVCSKAQNNGNHIERGFANLVAIEEGM